MATCLRELRVQSYLLVAPMQDAPFAVTLERCGQRSGPDLWAIRYKGMTLNHEAEWEWEPIPSERDATYLGRCRFNDPNAALDTWNRSRQGT